MRRHKDLITFLLSIPFVALLPVIFPRPEHSLGRTAVVVMYLVVALAVARLVAVGLARASLLHHPRQDAER